VKGVHADVRKLVSHCSHGVGGERRWHQSPFAVRTVGVDHDRGLTALFGTVFLIAWFAGSDSISTIFNGSAELRRQLKVVSVSHRGSSFRGIGHSVLTGPALSTMRTVIVNDRSRLWSGI
jgi:hypothetical protein